MSEQERGLTHRQRGYIYLAMYVPVVIAARILWPGILAPEPYGDFGFVLAAVIVPIVVYMSIWGKVTAEHE